MATITKITVTIDTTCNLGNYSNIRIGGTWEVALQPESNPDAVYTEVFRSALTSIAQEYARLDNRNTDDFLSALRGEPDELDY
jgi:hypothetical protein